MLHLFVIRWRLGEITLREMRDNIQNCVYRTMNETIEWRGRPTQKSLKNNTIYVIYFSLAMEEVEDRDEG